MLEAVKHPGPPIPVIAWYAVGVGLIILAVLYLISSGRRSKKMERELHAMIKKHKDE